MDPDLSLPIDNHRTLWLTEISMATFASQALDDLGSDGGVFVVLEDRAEGTFEVLAKAASVGAGQALFRVCANSFRNRNGLHIVGHSVGATN